MKYNMKSTSTLLFSQPNEFSVEYNINPYMRTDADVVNAKSNWNKIVRKVRKHSSVRTVDYETFGVQEVPVSELPDSVFIANHGLPLENGRMILSNMKHKERNPEIAYFRRLCRELGFRTLDMDEDIYFEGCGDSKRQPGSDNLWLGFGPRTDKGAVEWIDARTKSEVFGLEIVDDYYYHLDVCFTILDENSVMIIKDAFAQPSLNKIKRQFERILEVPEEDKKTLGGNSARMTDGTILVDEANKQTANLLKKNGYKVGKIDSTEFNKSGGSIDCLFLRLPPS